MRTIFNQEQRASLEDVFTKHKRPNMKLKLELATQLDVSEAKIQKWFQKRRQKERRRWKVTSSPRDLSEPTSTPGTLRVAEAISVAPEVVSSSPETTLASSSGITHVPEVTASTVVTNCSNILSLAEEPPKEMVSWVPVTAKRVFPLRHYIPHHFSPMYSAWLPIPPFHVEDLKAPPDFSPRTHGGFRHHPNSVFRPCSLEREH